MADGTFAVLLFAAGLWDMSANYCGTETGCLGKGATTPRIAVAAGELLERRADPAAAVYLRYDLGHKRGPFGEAAGLSIGEQGELWVGFGQTYGWYPTGSGFYAELHAMTGLYEAGDGLDLGGPIAFRSGAELGYQMDGGWRVALSYDHTSNAGIYADNPGVEVVQLKLSIPLN